MKLRLNLDSGMIDHKLIYKFKCNFDTLKYKLFDFDPLFKIIYFISSIYLITPILIVNILGKVIIT